jgi:hypothetical protein
MGAEGGTAGWPGEIRAAAPGDGAAVAALAAEFARSFEFSAGAFAASYPALLADERACLLLALSGGEAAGYLLGFSHLTF